VLGDGTVLVSVLKHHVLGGARYWDTSPDVLRVDRYAEV
jgi:hypothetical protein